MRALGIRGLGVSMPFKQAVIPLLDALDPLAARIGAVNTVVNDGGRLTGYNTDALGAVRALEEARPLAGARVLLLGAGGAARAIAHAARDRGARVHHRQPQRRARRARSPRAPAPPAAELGEAARAGDYDVVVNATSRGMREVDAASPVPEGAIRAGQVVMDIVYKPIETELVRAARRRGAVAVHGGRMLLHQAAGQFELYTGAPAPLEAMEAALSSRLAEGRVSAPPAVLLDRAPGLRAKNGGAPLADRAGRPHGSARRGAAWPTSWSARTEALMEPESVTLERAARALCEVFGPLVDADYLPGKTELRDALAARFELSQLLAEELCDELERAGAHPLRADGRGRRLAHPRSTRTAVTRASVQTRAGPRSAGTSVAGLVPGGMHGTSRAR